MVKFEKHGAILNKRSLGKEGEALALEFLKRRGYKVLETNFTCKYGEIDIVAKDGNIFCFIEVKLRSSLNFGLPIEAVGKRKIAHILQCAQYYCLKNNLKDVPMRFDIISILKTEKETKLSLIKNAITL